MAAKLAEDERTIGAEFPYVTAPDGTWRTMPASRSAGYAGDAHPDDEHRADASAWIEELPVIRRFRARVLGRR